MAASLAQISILSICWLALSAGHPHPYPVHQFEDSRQAYQPLQQFQVPASTRLLPNNLNDGVRYGQQPLMYALPSQQVSQQQYYKDPSSAQQQQQQLTGAQEQYLESLLAANYPSQQYYQSYAADSNPISQQQYIQPQYAQRLPAAAETPKPERFQALAQQQLYLEQQAAAQEQMQLLQEEAERQKYMLQYFQQRPNSNYVYYSLPQQQAVPQVAPVAERLQHHGLRPFGLQRFQIRSGQEQNNASSEIQESQEGTQPPQSAEEIGPSIAQAKPQAISVAGPGGVAAAAPVGTAVVGPGGMALSAPSATALAGTKPKPGQSPASSKIRQAIRYLY